MLNPDTSPFPLLSAFLENTGAPLDFDEKQNINAEAALQDMVSSAAALWPDLDLDCEVFVRHLAGHIADHHESLNALSRGDVPLSIHKDDLFLACACAQGVRGAIEHLEKRYAKELGAIVARFTQPGRSRDDLYQILREKLFVAHGKRPPRIAEYRGTGPLIAWLRVTAVRAFLDETRRASRKEREDPVSRDRLLDAAAVRDFDDWELDFLKTHYRKAFKTAFADAVRSLESGERNILRFHVIEGLTVDEIGALYHMHRSSVSRRLVAARKTLLDLTRKELGSLLKVDGEEFDSIMNMIQSRLDVSLTRLLKS